MHPVFDQILTALETTTRGISAAELRYCPEPGKWCAGEILEHLTLAYTGTTLGMTRTLERGTLEPDTPALKQKFFRGLVLGFGFFPPGRKAPKQVVPTGKDPDYALASAKNSLPAMDLAISACAERFGDKAAILRHSVLGPLSAAQWRRFHLVHTVHHLKQIENRRALAAKAAK